MGQLMLVVDSGNVAEGWFRDCRLSRDVTQSAAAKCAIWSACAFTKDGRAVARAT
jgi:hypothetical protein